MQQKDRWNTMGSDHAQTEPLVVDKKESTTLPFSTPHPPEPSSQRKARRRRLGKRNSSGNSQDKPYISLLLRPQNVLMLCLLLGLVIILINVVCLQTLVEHSQHTASQQQQHSNNNNNNKRTILERQTVESDWQHAQEPLLDLLQEATGSDEGKERLPHPHQVSDLYGDSLYVYGLDTCQAFQEATYSHPAEHFVSTAGTFNTGTNLMAELLIANCVMKERMKKYHTAGVRWQVVWGKHTPIFNETFRTTHRTYNDSDVKAQNMFPAVMIRDPYPWMQSMCRHPYGAKWPHHAEHCPNPVPNQMDRQLLKSRDGNHMILRDTSGTFKVPMEATQMNITVVYKEFAQYHDSLVGFWNDFYRDYIQADFPRLMVRFEDLVFHPKQVTKLVCECAGGQLKHPNHFKYIVDSAKKGVGAHGKTRTNYVDALTKYGTEDGRYNGFAADDLEYVRQHLDPELMEMFGYKYPAR